MLAFQNDNLLKSFQRFDDDIKFARVVTLTRTATEIRKDVIMKITREFNLRNKFTTTSKQGGINITPATKQKEQAEVFSNSWYVPEHDKGAEREPIKGWIAVPGDDFSVTGVDPKKKVIPKRLRYPNIFDQKIKSRENRRPFLIKGKGGTPLVAVRRTKKRNPLDILYVLKRRVRLKQVDIFRKVVDESYKELIEKIWEESWQKYVMK
jgi:hypothetical protein